MKPRTYVLMVLAIVTLLAALATQGCLFGGGADDEGGEDEGGAPADAGGAPDEGMGMMGDVGEGGAEAPAETAAPAEVPGEPSAPAETGGGDADALVAAGIEAKRAGDYDTAMQSFEAAVAADPNNVDAHLGLAWVCAEKKMTEKAIAEFNKVKELGTDADRMAEVDEALARLSK